MGSQRLSSNSVRLDDELQRRVEQCAEAAGVSPTEVVSSAVREYLRVRDTNGGGGVQDPSRRRLAESADRIAASVPDAEWAKLPTDLAQNFEHYRYGYPRED